MDTIQKLDRLFLSPVFSVKDFPENCTQLKIQFNKGKTLETDDVWYNLNENILTNENKINEEGNVIYVGEQALNDPWSLSQELVTAKDTLMQKLSPKEGSEELSKSLNLLNNKLESLEGTDNGVLEDLKNRLNDESKSRPFLIYCISGQDGKLTFNFNKREWEKKLTDILDKINEIIVGSAGGRINRLNQNRSKKSKKKKNRKYKKNRRTIRKSSTVNKKNRYLLK